MSDRAYVFAGGGSGGHLFPGIAVAERLREVDPGARCVFLCSTRNIDARIMRTTGFEWRAVRARALSLRPLGLVRFVWGWGGSVRACRDVLREVRGSCAQSSEVVVVAMGGFVAAPVVQAARAEGIPVVLVNLDAVPGKANRWIARHADRVVTAARVEGKGGAGWERVRPIVRRGALRPFVSDAGACRERFGLAPEVPTLLVLGGSQGARSINELMMALAAGHAEELEGWQVIHQPGAGEAERVREAYDVAGVRGHVAEFIEEVGVAWGAAELAVSRAGAGSVAEAWANGVPTVFAPYPFHRDQHQRANAAELVEAGAAALGVDYVSAERNLEAKDGVGSRVVELLADAGWREAMRKALGELGAADGAEAVAGAVRGYAPGRGR